MKNSSRSAKLLFGKLTGFLVAASLIASSSAVSAANLYWDGGNANIVGNGDGISGGGNGTWNDTISNWDAGSGVAHTAWISGSAAVFGGTVGTITLDSNITAGGIVFSTTGYILSGTGKLTLNGELTVDNGVATVSTIIDGGALTKMGAGTLTLTAANAYTGATIINGGIVTVNVGSGSLASTSGITINSGGTLEFSGGTNKNGLGGTNKSITVNTGGTLLIGSGNAMGYNGAANYADITLNGGTFQLNAIQYIRSLTLNGGQVTGTGAIQWYYADSPVAITVVSDATIATGVNFNGGPAQTVSVNADKTLTISGVITGAGLIKTGDGSLVFTGANTYGGATTINGGTLQIGAGGTTGSLGTGAVTVNAGATLAFNRSDSLTVANAIAGAGNLTKQGAGTLTLNAATYTGATHIDAGSLVLNNAAIPQTSQLQMLSGTSLKLNDGTGTLTLNNANTSFAGHSSGTLTDIDGSLSLSGGHQLNIGTSSGFETLKISHDLTLNGTFTTLQVTGLTNHDQIDLGGTLHADGINTLNIDLMGATSLAAGDYTLIGTSTGTLNADILEKFTLAGLNTLPLSRATLKLDAANKNLLLNLLIPLRRTPAQHRHLLRL